MEKENKTNKVKKFFRVDKKFKLEYNDIRALLTVINVLLIMQFGLSIAWFGLIISIIGLIKDLATDRHINGMVMHFATIVLNLYFIIISTGA